MKSNLLGFTFGKVKRLWEPLLTTRTKNRIKEKIKTITSRRKSVDLETRLGKLAQVSIGWCANRSLPTRLSGGADSIGLLASKFHSYYKMVSISFVFCC